MGWILCTFTEEYFEHENFTCKLVIFLQCNRTSTQVQIFSTLSTTVSNASKVRNRLSPGNVQRLFILSSNGEDDRRKFNFKSLYPTWKQMCISVYGVLLLLFLSWNVYVYVSCLCQSTICFVKLTLENTLKWVK